MFSKLLNIKLKTEKKGRFNYASWTEAVKELKKVYPNAKFKTYEKQTVKDGVLVDTGNVLFRIGDNAGAFVKVSVTVGDYEHIEFYPITDNYNKAIPYDRIDVMHINTAIKRGLVKACAFLGLGLNIYAGEDLPEEDNEK